MNLKHTLVVGGLVLTLGLALGGQALAKPTSSGWFPERTSPPAASFYTAAALKADGLRWQAMARLYQRQSTSSVASSNGFDARDALVGGAVGLVLAICLLGLVLVSRKFRAVTPASM